MELITFVGEYELYGFNRREEDGYVHHYREMRSLDGRIIASHGWKAGRNGFELCTGDKYAQYKARCAFPNFWER